MITTRDHEYRLLAWRFKQAGIANPELDARLLVQAAARCDDIEMIREPGKRLSDVEMERLRAFEARRLAHEPVSRILGTREFWGLAFEITPATLDPRPDSETLVETALELLRDSEAPAILDIGTGTGCLLIALLHERKDATGIGVDISEAALAVAARNAVANGCDGRAAFRRASWAEGIDTPFDLVISNPPYIVAGTIGTLDPEVRGFDPHLALDGGADGLDAYRALADVLPRLLRAEGHVVVELGQGQAEAVTGIFLAAGLVVCRVVSDLGLVPRALVATLPRG
ncbi:peptide chain release factor N(5)-glutamine methyltransferase [Parvibaculum sp.]|uniref:peptide chain release factor N(5)-glutamine methyltransferase n=1 Tax=Parvibaculum sp. TaxID=2024848 RepID=UPI002CFB72C5|nr:peptide chain release factor N(5)-glutamine methyltransferase [Parvibaculum sp.]HUD51196.1 peptide chain release factor N(5)-glutamine methyltransferase [Parvibaculum sp.]